MSLPNTDSLTTGFPLVIPTSTQQPPARLVLRNDRGQVVQQWLVKQNKCTLGSASSCGLRCELPGIAPYHALLVIGARQVFIRALAPKLTRNSRPFNEILLTDVQSHFEIAGHRFELTRKSDAVSTAAIAEGGKPERLKFTLARPFELNSRRASATTAVANQPAPPLPATTLDPAIMDSRWVAQLIQSAIEPLENQLNNLLLPLNELQTESRKQRRLRKKRQSSKQRPGSADGAELPSAASQLSPQVQELVVKHSAAMDVLTQRITDINQQLSAIEQIIAQEREDTRLDDVPAENPQLVQQSQAIEQLQKGVVSVTSALQSLQTQQSQEWDHELEWKSSIQEQLAGVTQVVDSLAATVSEVHALASRQRGPEEIAQQRREEQQWKVDVQQRLAGLCQVVDGLSLNVSEIHTSTRADATPEQVQQQEEEQRWKTEVKQQLVGMSEVIASLTSSVAEVHRSTTAEPTPDELQLAEQQRQAELEWKSSVQRQLSSLGKVVDGVSTNLSELQRTTLQEISQRLLAPSQPEDQLWQAELRQQLSDMSQVIDRLSNNVAEIQTTTLHDHAPTESAEQAIDQQWQAELHSQLADMRQVIDGLSANVAEMHTTTLNDQVQLQTTSTPAADQEWQSDFRQQLGDLSQVIDSLSANMAEMYSTALNERIERQTAPASAGDSQWQLEVRQQLAGLTQVVDALSATVTEVHQIAIGDAEPTAVMPTALEQAVDEGESAESQTGIDEADHGLERTVHEYSAEMVAEIDYADEAEVVETKQSVCKLSASAITFAELESDEAQGTEEDLSLDSEQQLDGKEVFDSDAGLVTELAVEPESAWSDPVPDAAPRQALWEVPISENGGDEFLFGGQPLTAAEANELSAEAAGEALHWDQPPVTEESLLEESQAAIIEPLDDSLPSWWREEEEQSPAEPTAAVADSEEFFGLNQYQPAAGPATEDSLPQDEDLGQGERNLHGWEEEQTVVAKASDALEADDDNTDAWAWQQEPIAAQSPLGQECEVADRAEASSGLDAAAAQQNAEEDASVEDYMRKLLARMRGVPDEHVEPRTPARTVEPTVVRATASAEVVPSSSMESIPDTGTAPRTTVVSPTTVVDSLETTEPFDPEKYMPRALAPERTQSLAAMRELANSSARTAIHRSTRQRHVSSIVLKAAIAMVGLTVGMVLVAINGLNVNVGLVATVASFLVTAIWGYDSLTSIRPMLQAGLILRPESNGKTALVEEAAKAKEDQA